MNDVKLSIGIPTYNQGIFLEKAILSILNQTEKPYEIVISNNHSDDKITDAVLEKYKNEVKIIVPPKVLTMMENWNFLCKNLSGSHVSLLSSDDFYEPNFVESFFKVVKKDGVLYRFGFNLVNESNEIISEQKINSAKSKTVFPENFYEQIMGPKTSFAAFVVKKDSLAEVNYFDENLKLVGDWGLWLNLSPLGTFYYADNIVSNYRTDYRPSISADRFSLNISDLLYIYSNIQEKIIQQYSLKQNINKNAIKLHLYKICQIKSQFNLNGTPDLLKFESLISNKVIKSKVEYNLRSYFQNVREYFFKK